MTHGVGEPFGMDLGSTVTEDTADFHSRWDLGADIVPSAFAIGIDQGVTFAYLPILAGVSGDGSVGICGSAGGEGDV